MKNSTPKRVASGGRNPAPEKKHCTAKSGSGGWTPSVLLLLLEARRAEVVLRVMSGLVGWNRAVTEGMKKVRYETQRRSRGCSSIVRLEYECHVLDVILAYLKDLV